MTTLKSDRVALQRPHNKHTLNWIELRRRNRFFLQPWEPKWDVNAPSKKAYKRLLAIYHRGWKSGLARSFFIFRNADQALMGGITLGQIRYGASYSALLGYWVGQEFSRKGYMNDALNLVIGYAFNELKLNRLEACCLPKNQASIGLLKKNGFTYEGVARKLLEVNDQYEDHCVFSLLYSDVAKK